MRSHCDAPANFKPVSNIVHPGLVCDRELHRHPDRMAVISPLALVLFEKIFLMVILRALLFLVTARGIKGDGCTNKLFQGGFIHVFTFTKIDAA